MTFCQYKLAKKKRAKHNSIKFHWIAQYKVTVITVLIITHVVALSLYCQEECTVECVDVECSEHGKADKQYFTAFCESHASILC